MKFLLPLVMLFLLSPLSGPSQAKKKLTYKLIYDVRFSVADSAALVKISIDNSALVKELDFNLRQHRLVNIEANGELTRKAERLIWTPPQK